MDNLPRALAIADPAIVLDNTGPSHRRVLEVDEGRITYLAEQLPGWLAGRMPVIGVELLHDIAVGAHMGRSDSAGEAKRSLAASLMDALRTLRANSDAALDSGAGPDGGTHPRLRAADEASQGQRRR